MRDRASFRLDFSREESALETKQVSSSDARATVEERRFSAA